MILVTTPDCCMYSYRERIAICAALPERHLDESMAVTGRGAGPISRCRSNGCSRLRTSLQRSVMATPRPVKQSPDSGRCGRQRGDCASSTRPARIDLELETPGRRSARDGSRSVEGTTTPEELIQTQKATLVFVNRRRMESGSPDI